MMVLEMKFLEQIYSFYETFDGWNQAYEHRAEKFEYSEDWILEEHLE